MQKNIQKPNKLNYFLLYFIFVFSLFSATVFAFSLDSFFGFGGATNTKDIDTGKTETLQNLKVFEPNKIFSKNDSVSMAMPEIVKENSISFETDNTLVDDFSGTTEDNHGDNAVYTVQKGDSIYSIASYFGVSVSTITSFNHMSNKIVNVGDVLEVPTVTGVMYTIKKGDTLAGISKKYSIDPDDVSLYNGLISGDDLAIGDEIYLPGAKEIEVLVKKDNKKDNTSGKNKNSNLANKSGRWERGDTSHLNTMGDIAKYSTLPKYPGYYIMPVPGAVRTQKMHGHNGVDLSNKIGSPVLASAGGVVRVAKVGGYNFGYGNYIIITHPNGTETVYAHLLSVGVSVGQSVNQGQQIGQLGSSGNSTGPHTHFEIRGAYNPWAW